ncbi:MAG: hypothetical protein Q7R70_04820 [Candidatus Diapherotrites archaeon]|nr:hypothetical protein [Candidatus Diapherotrites archaeon]
MAGTVHEFNEVDADLGWYEVQKDGKKKGTPSNWVLLWADPGRMVYYRNHKLVRLGEEFAISSGEPVMILEEPLLDRKTMENNFTVLCSFGPIEHIVLEDNGKRAAVVSVSLKLRLGNETKLVELEEKYTDSVFTKRTDFNWQGYAVRLVSISVRPEASVVLKVEKSGIVH